ncbi:hypothetical protein KCP78_17840 [Salmonella enterica subsp. enterica]|nr:hypothetical protein KCP78_17840 [Salmonella enterica subsp. enterica]
MRSQLAVVMAAVFNFLAFCWGLSVAYAIVHMLPTDLLLNMRFRVSSLWSFHVAGGDYLEPWHCSISLPASSSHTLIGAYIGIGLTTR